MPNALPPEAPLWIVLNQASGSGDAQAVEASLRERLQVAGRRFELLRAEDPGRLPALADRAAEQAQRDDGAVVVVGGDGTINAVTQAVLPRQVRFGVLPQGTFNFFGRCHRLPEGDVGQGIAALLSSHEKPVQVGRVNGHAFLVNASLGLYPTLLERREQDKQRFGRRRWVALGSGLRTLTGRFPRLRLRFEGDAPVRDLDAMTLVVGNNRLQLEKIGIEPAAAVERGRLVGMAVRPVGRARLVGMALRGLLGQLGEADAMESFAFRTLRVDVARRRRLKVALDGEIQTMTLPLAFDVAPEPLRLLVPAGARDDA